MMQSPHSTRRQSLTAQAPRPKTGLALYSLPSSDGGRYEIDRQQGAVCDIVADRRINLSLLDLQIKRNIPDAFSAHQTSRSRRYKVLLQNTLLSLP